MTLLFSEAVSSNNPPGGPFGAGDFTIVTSSGVDVPKIVDIVTAANPRIELTFDRHIPLQEWTTVIADVVSSTTGRIILKVADNDRVDVGYLPCDVNQNGHCEPFDLLLFQQYVNGLVSPKVGIIEDYVDINRSGVSDPFDLLVFRQLVNGVSPPATKAWNGEYLPGQP